MASRACWSATSLRDKTLSRYLELLFGHWVRFLVLLLVLPLGLSAASVLTSRTWDAAAAVWVEEPSYLGSAVTPNGWNQYLSPAQNQTDSLLQMLKTRSFGEALGNVLDQSGAISSPAERGAVIGSLNKQLKVTAAGSHLVTMTYTCSHPTVCLEVMNAALKVYHDRLSTIEKQQADLASSVLTTQLTSAQSSLKQSQTALETYLTQHPSQTLADKDAIPALGSLASRHQVDADQVQTIEQRLETARGTSAAVERVVDTMSNVIDPPRVNSQGLLGDRTSLTRAGLIGAACWLAAIVYLMLLAWVDRTARDPKELENRLHVPVIVTVPLFHEMKKAG